MRASKSRRRRAVIGAPTLMAGHSLGRRRRRRRQLNGARSGPHIDNVNCMNCQRAPKLLPPLGLVLVAVAEEFQNKEFGRFLCVRARRSSPACRGHL